MSAPYLTLVGEMEGLLAGTATLTLSRHLRSPLGGLPRMRRIKWVEQRDRRLPRPRPTPCSDLGVLQRANGIGAHHLVVFVLEDVAMPDVLALTIERTLIRMISPG